MRGMRTLLVDDDVADQLREEARKRSPRSWDEYATELWHDLIEGGTN
jgi:hypothetical protein